MSEFGFGARIKQMRKKIGLTQQELSDKTGISQQTLGHMEAGRLMGTKRIHTLARALNTTAAYLDYGVPDNDVALVTIIGWRDVIDWCHARKKINTQAIDISYIRYTHPGSNKEILPYQFALQVKSYISCQFRTFEKGSYLICDPTLNPVNNCYVIGERPGDKEVVIRKFIEDGDRVYLHPLYYGLEGEILTKATFKVRAVIISTIDSLINFNENLKLPA